MKYINLIFISALLLLQACASYTTPAAGVSISSIEDADIAELMAREPQAVFPSRIAIVRVQAAGYTSRTNYGYGKGRYSVLTTRDVEEDSDFEKISRWQSVNGVAPIGKLLLSERMDSLKDIRIAAAQLKTDIVFVYSIDTSFHLEGQSFGPLSLISLGLFKNKQAHVNAVTSGAFIDVRSGFVYGVVETTEKEQQRTNIWESEDAIDSSRLIAEASSFKKFVEESGELWEKIVLEHAYN